MPASLAASLNVADLVPGSHLVDGSTLATIVKFNMTATTGLVALAGGGLSGLTPVVQTYINEFTTVASANDSCALPPCIQGMEYTIVNSGAQNLRVYCQVGNPNNLSAAGAPLADNIVSAGGANSTFVAIPPNGTGVFSAVALGRWKSQNY
jgi:hypothetical protein